MTMTDPWAAEALTWDQDPVVVAYADAAAASLLASVPVRPGARVLDFGCGTGLLTERLAPRVREVVAVDASPAMVEVLAAKALANVRAGVVAWTSGTITNDALVAGPFDLVVCSSVCAFLDGYPAAVALLAGRLAPRGYFVQWDWELNPSDPEPFGLTADGITRALQGAGLEVVSVATGFDVPIEGQRMRPLMGIGRRVPNGASVIHLRPATPDDLDRLRRWDAAPHVIAAKGTEDWAWERALARSPEWREQLIAEVDGAPIGFVQIIDPAREDSRYWGECPAGLRAVDIWIGEAAHLGRGLGTAMMRVAIARCFADPSVDGVLIDPMASNDRARRFYERLGFRFVEHRRFGDDECAVYRLDRSAWRP